MKNKYEIPGMKIFMSNQMDDIICKSPYFGDNDDQDSGDDDGGFAPR